MKKIQFFFFLSLFMVESLKHLFDYGGFVIWYLDYRFYHTNYAQIVNPDKTLDLIFIREAIYEKNSY